MKRTLTVLIGVALVATACGVSSTPTAGPPDASASAPPVSAASTPPATSPSAAPTPAATPRWMEAGTMSLGRGKVHAVLLGDGSVLVVGNDEPGCVRADSAAAEAWDPASGTWSAAPSLAKGRADFAAVALLDGRALVTGGVNPGDRDDIDAGGHQAYSSTYIYDSQPDPAGWSKTGGLGTARISPAAATLLDGRVLVLGGYYLGGGEGSLPGIALAGYRADDGGPADGVTPGDVSPPDLVPVLATAELYDPVAGSWSATGSLRFARLDPAAVTLADGRVLVVGSRRGGDWNYTRPIVRDRALASAEIYDPTTGRFSMVDDVPDTDWSSITDLDPVEADSMWTVDPGRTLVALADGGALLFDKAVEWYGNDNMEGRIVRTLRFDPVAGSWSVIDVRVWQHKATGDPPAPMVEVVAGRSRSEPLVARLADGRILVAGGIDGATIEPSIEADLYDPATGTWTALPAMPEARAGGTAVVLPGGSVLLVGGDGEFAECSLVTCECGEGQTGLRTAVRFVPGP